MLKISDKNLKAACLKKILFVQNNGKDDSRLLVGNNITYWQQKLPSQVNLTFESILFQELCYLSAMKGNEIGSFVETWMDLETVIQSEVSQKEKNMVY